MHPTVASKVYKLYSITLEIGKVGKLPLESKSDQTVTQRFAAKINQLFNCITLCLQSQNRNKLYMLAIKTKYACKIENRPKVRCLWFLDESRENEISLIASIIGPYWNRLQAHIVRCGLEIVSIFSPLWILDCIHIRSQLLSSL